MLTLVSCSSEDSPVIPPIGSSGTLVKKTIETLPDGEVITTDYTYNGHKLDKVTYSYGYYDKYTYTGNLITKIEYFDADDVLDTKELFTYNDDNKLISYTKFIYALTDSFREDYVYNVDGTISVSQYYGDLSAQDDLGSTGVIYFTEGEITKIERTVFGMGMTHTDLYTYDNKNNAYKNVVGAERITFQSFSADGNNHNTSHIFYDEDDVNVTISHTYNSNNYPVTETSVGSDGDTITTQFFYE